MECKIGYNIYKIRYRGDFVETKYTKIDFESRISVDCVYTLFYMEMSKDFSYGGESHDFWEMVYIDKGEMVCTAGQKRFMLKSGELTFHSPGEFHNLSGNGKTDSNISIITFDARGIDRELYEGKIFRLNAEERGIISMLFEEGMTALVKEDENNPLTHAMKVSDHALSGYGQMIKNLLEIFLIKLARNKATFTKDSRLSYRIDGVNVPLWIKEVVDYLDSHLEDKVTVAEIATHFGVSESLLKKEFAKYYDGGVINYFHRRKAEAAKRLIRNTHTSFCEIADRLGFDNSQYFTKFFKTMTKMTPSEYRKSIISRKSSCQPDDNLL